MALFQQLGLMARLQRSFAAVDRKRVLHLTTAASGVARREFEAIYEALAA